jgi:hypothetical protein
MWDSPYLDFRVYALTLAPVFPVCLETACFFFSFFVALPKPNAAASKSGNPLRRIALYTRTCASRREPESGAAKLPGFVPGDGGPGSSQHSPSSADESVVF